MAFLDWLGSWFPSSAGRAADWGAAALEQAPTPAPQPWSFGDVARSAWEPVKAGLSTFGEVAKSALPLAQLGAGVMGGVQSYRAGEQLAEQGKRAKESQQLQQEMTRQAAGAAQPVSQF